MMTISYYLILETIYDTLFASGAILANAWSSSDKKKCECEAYNNVSISNWLQEKRAKAKKDEESHIKRKRHKEKKEKGKKSKKNKRTEERKRKKENPQY